MSEVRRATSYAQSSVKKIRALFSARTSPFAILGISFMLVTMAIYFVHTTAAHSLATVSPQPTPSPLISTPVTLGSIAPDFSLATTQKGDYHLLEHRGTVVILSFLRTYPDSTTKSNASRSQMIVLESIDHQYGLKGVDVVVVDATAIETGKRPTPINLLHTSNDWKLDHIPLLVDDRLNSTATNYGVVQTPSTYLIAADGHITQRWDGMVQSAQIAFALQQLID